MGVPRNFAIFPEHVLFLRSSSGRDGVNALWQLREGVESILVDPRTLLVDSSELPAAERARRERMREQGGGITAYSASESGEQVVFALAGGLWSLNLASAKPSAHEVAGPVIDPQISPDGRFAAWSTGSTVELIDLQSGQSKTLFQNDSANVQVGLADFIAAEELGRSRGFWWAPDSSAIVLQQTDETKVQTWWISDNANPAAPPREIRYPQAGTPNAQVRIFQVSLTGEKTEIVWDQSSYEYFVRFHWAKNQRALITFANREQTRLDTFALTESKLELVHSAQNETFVEVIPGQPIWNRTGALVSIEDQMDTDTRSLVVAGRTISPTGTQVLSLIGEVDGGYLVSATATAIDRGIALITEAGELNWLEEDGMNASSSIKNGLRLSSGTDLNSWNRRFNLMRGNDVVHSFTNHGERPNLKLNLHTIQTGPHAVNTAVLFPTDHIMGSTRLPVLMRPYGGPHGAQVLNSAYAYAEDQWWADQGFVVVIADGRGTPARGPHWERAIYKDFVSAVLADQISAIEQVATIWPADVDASRVGISGWSFGGYLSALAVLAAPEHFHAAIAGAPVTRFDWYDTAYTERYLGNPHTDSAPYDAGNLLNLASDLQRPLMLIHGLVDDNVVVGHTLALSNALMSAGRAHTVLPLTGITHMASDETVAENLLHLQLEFFKNQLG